MKPSEAVSTSVTFAVVIAAFIFALTVKQRMDQTDHLLRSVEQRLTSVEQFETARQTP